MSSLNSFVDLFLMNKHIQIDPCLASEKMGNMVSRLIEGTQTEELADVPRLSEDNHREILVHLPVKDVVRYGTVCKAWRRITTDRGFLAENARRQPAEVLLYRYVYRQVPVREWPYSSSWLQDLVLDAILVSGDMASRRSLIRYPKPYNGGFLLLAIADGVLLFKKDDGVYILCNPTTRMWADLPLLPRPPLGFGIVGEREFAFYLHRPSGEYRVLCRHNLVVRGTWCILSTGDAGPRNIDTKAAEAAGINALLPSLSMAVSTPLPLNGRLHWPPQRGSVVGLTKMVVFDMLSERFTQMDGPPTTRGANHVKLFSMDGLLVGAEFLKEHIGLWFLIDNYGDAARWELRHRVAKPWGHYHSRSRSMLSLSIAADERGNVMLGDKDGLVVYNVRKKETVKTIDSVETADNINVLVSKHVFTANLVQHPHFSTRSAAVFPFVHF
jgi:hypothetical protein